MGCLEMVGNNAFVFTKSQDLVLPGTDASRSQNP
jgi:hypothetical protein